MRRSNRLQWALTLTVLICLFLAVNRFPVLANGNAASPPASTSTADEAPLLSTWDLPGFEPANPQQVSGFMALAQRLTGGLLNPNSVITNLSSFRSQDLFTREFVLSFLAYPLSENDVIAFDTLADDPTNLLAALTDTALVSSNDTPPGKVAALDNLGEKSMGFSFTLGQEPVAYAIDLVWVRRGDVLQSLWVIHPLGTSPSVNLYKLAALIDERVGQRFAGTVFRPAGELVPEITTYIPTPLDVSTRPGVIATNLLLAALMMLPFVVAAEIFTRLSGEREGSWRGRLRLPAGLLHLKERLAGSGAVRPKPGLLNSNLFRISLVMLFYGLVFSLLDRTWKPLTVTGLVLFLNMTVAYGMVGIADDIMQWRVLRKWGLPADINLRLTNIFIAAASTITSRLLTLVPGLMFGTPEALILEESRLGRRRKNTLLKVSAYTLLGIGFGLWALTAITTFLQRQALSAGMSESIGALEGFLLIVFAVALENTFVQMLGLPGSFGEMLRKKNRWSWMLGLIAVTFVFFHTLINPRGELARALQESNVWIFLGASGAFVLFTFCLWFYLQVKDRRTDSRGESVEQKKIRQARTRNAASQWIILAVSIIALSVLLEYLVSPPRLEQALTASPTPELTSPNPNQTPPSGETVIQHPSFTAPGVVQNLCYLPSRMSSGDDLESYLLNGVQLVAAQYGAQVGVAGPETYDAMGYAGAVDKLVQGGCSLIVANRFYLEQTFQSAASANPGQNFMLVGISSSLEDLPALANLWKVDYAMSEGAYLAGYLAASVSQSGKVATFGGLNIPNVVSSMNCYNMGVAGYNRAHQAQVGVLGWDFASQQGSFADGFASPAQGTSIADDLYKQGADILFPVAGADKNSTGSGALAAAAGQGKFILGTDLDWGWAFPDSARYILTSVETRYDQSIALAVDALAEGNFTGGLQRGSLASGEIRLSPLRSFSGRVPAGIKTELNKLVSSASLNAPRDEDNREGISGFIFDKGAGGENWHANSPLIFRIFADAGRGLLYTEEVITDAKGNFFLAIPFILQPGMVIEASDCLSTRQTTLVPFSIDQIDLQADAISGTAPAGTTVFVIITNDAWLRVTTGDDGTWRADFSGLEDITPATIFQATAEDESGWGNGTVIKTSYNEWNR